MMKFEEHDRYGLLLLSTFTMLFVLVSIGCSQSNKTKIVGSWKAQSIDNTDGSVQYTLFKFYKEGHVSKKTGLVIDEQLSKPNNKMVGYYKFEDDQNNVLITWDEKNWEKTKVSFPQKNKMILGNYDMEKIM